MKIDEQWECWTLCVIKLKARTYRGGRDDTWDNSLSISWKVIKKKEPLLDYAPINSTNLDVTFWHVFYHAPTNKWKACRLALFFLFFFVRKIRPIQRSEKIRKRPQLVWKKRKGAGFLFLYMCGSPKHELKISDRNSRHWAGHRSNATCVSSLLV